MTKHTKIPNDILEALLLANLSKREWAVIMVIARKTYGWHKENDDISGSQIAELSNLRRNHVNSTVLGLVRRNILVKNLGKKASNLGIQKDHKKWLSLVPKQDYSTSPKTGLVPKQDMSQNGTKLVPKRDKTSPKTGHTKETTKEIQKKVESKALAASKNEISFPDDLNQTAWAEWVKYRSQSRLKPYTEMGCKKLWPKLTKLTHEQQQECVDLSIEKNWQGLFPEKLNGQAKTNSKRAYPGDGKKRTYESFDPLKGTVYDN